MLKNQNFKEGDAIESILSYSKKDVLEFARLTGDDNPIHIDEEFGQNSRFGRTIVHGNFVVASFAVGIGNKFPGPGTIAIKMESVFIRPVYVGEEYRLISKISSIDRKEHLAIIKHFLKNGRGKTCVRVISTIKNEQVFTD